jgi:hypothetical protein
MMTEFKSNQEAQNKSLERELEAVGSDCTGSSQLNQLKLVYSLKQKKSKQTDDFCRTRHGRDDDSSMIEVPWLSLCVNRLLCLLIGSIKLQAPRRDTKVIQILTLLCKSPSAERDQPLV